MSRVFVGNLPMDIREDDLADLFLRYGRILGIDIKTPRNPPAYAFVDYDDSRSAEDAVRERDGYDFAGERLRVEISRSGGRGGGGGGGGRGRERHGGPPGDNSVIVTGLPKCGSDSASVLGCWRVRKRNATKPAAQWTGECRAGAGPRRSREPRAASIGAASEAKAGASGRRGAPPSNSHCVRRSCALGRVGHVVYTDVDRMGGGIVEFSNRHDADEAWRQMDGAEFSNPFDTVRISVHLPNTSYTDGGPSR
eukprot:scaffold7381_cov310-Pinguiococcus_pyrenoidosus.AAC.126